MLIVFLLTAALVASLFGQMAPSAADQAGARAPFGLPFATSPGPATWLLGQAYGNIRHTGRNCAFSNS